MQLRSSSKRAQNMLPHSDSIDQGKAVLATTKNVNESEVVAQESRSSKQEEKARLTLNSKKNHKPEMYDDLELNFPPKIFSSMERYLPNNMLTAPRHDKVKYIHQILHDYLPSEKEKKDRMQKEYKQEIISKYQLLHKELYIVDPTTFFVPTFLRAIKDNTEQSFRSIMSEPAPGIFTFEMLQPYFCELLISEVENFEKWVNAAKVQIMRPNTMNKYGVVLDDFGLETMLDKLMKDFICPLSKVFFEQIGGSTLDSHHGFVVEYGQDKDVDLGFHVDDSEVTLNVCLGREFSGGELFFRGMRCDQHIETESYPIEVFDYSHVPGQAVLHHGRHRHGARATTAGHRINLILWCRSSMFREMKRYKSNFSSWCGVCYHEKKKNMQESVDKTRLALFKRKDKAT